MEVLVALLFEQGLIKEPDFPEQEKFVDDPAQFLIAQCTRRAGKSSALALKFFKAMERHPRSQCFYISLTRESAKAIMWGILQEQTQKLGINARFIESTLTMRMPNGSSLKLLGAKMANFKERIKGVKTPAAAIDESQDFGDHLQSLVDDVLTPAMADYRDSWLALTGTPGAVPKGYFYEASQQKKFGYSVHKWSILNNPYLPNAKEFIEMLKNKNQWDDHNPTLRREWMNEWVLDLASLVIHYDIEKNHFDRLPLLRTPWNHIMGIDLGFKDADAIAILAWNECSRNVYLVEELQVKGQDISSLAEQVSDLSKRYDVSKMVIDTGGLGKKIAEEMIRRHQIPVIAADKTRKFENLKFLDSSLRRQTFFAKKDSLFASDSLQLQVDWDKSTPDKTVMKDTFHSDIIDSVLYAFRESPAYSYDDPKLKPKHGTPEYYKQEVERMWQDDLERFTKQEQQEKGFV